MAIFINSFLVATAGFLPTDIAGCKLWLDASQITGLSDGNAVSTWSDASGNGNDATQSSTARPIYKTNILNGRPSVRFDGTNDEMLLTSSLPSGTSTIFCVMRKRTTGVLLGALSNNSIRSAGLLSYRNATFYCFGGSGNSNIYYFNGGNAEATTASVWCQVDNGSGITLFENGSSISLTNFTFGAFGSYTVVGGYFGEFGDGDIMEIIYYDTALGTTDRQSVEDYLATKYGL
jgi:hypothetical protein